MTATRHLVVQAPHKVRPASIRPNAAPIASIVQWPTACRKPATGSSPLAIAAKPVDDRAHHQRPRARLHEEFKRRIKTQTVLPSADTAAMLCGALLASGQISMRKVDGWQMLAIKSTDQPINPAA